jgi:hypothetical protein
MACNSNFVQYIVDQCSGAGEIAVRKMMGDYFYISDVDDRNNSCASEAENERALFLSEESTLEGYEA